jgi:ubiquinone biosynthesis protein
MSQLEKLRGQGVHPELIVKRGMRLFFRMVFQDKFFHGDLHAGNLFVMPGDKIGLIDFGVVGRLSDKVRDSIADMFVSLAQQDYERLAHVYVEMSPYNETTDVDQFARDLRDLIAPYFGLSFKNVNTGRVLLDSTSLAAKHGVSVPRDLLLFFKSIVTIEGMGRLVVQDFDILQQILEISDEIVKARYNPDKVIRELTFVAKDSASLLYGLPRQIKQLTRKLNSPNHRWKMEIDELQDVRHSIERTGNLLYLGIVIGALIMSSSVALHYDSLGYILNVPVISAIGYIMAAILGVLAFYNYFKRS